MTARFSGKAAASGTVLALAMLVAGCGGGSSDLNQAATAQQNAALPTIAAPNGQDWTQTVEETPEGGYRMGNPNAPVKLLEYASISCPHCAEFTAEGSEQLRERYVKSGQVSWEYRPFLLFPTDPGVFMLLRCQGPQAFFRLADQLYATQRDWLGRTQTLGQAELARLQALSPQQQAGELAKAIGVDQFFRQRGMPQARIDQCLADQAGLTRLAEIQQHGSREDNVTGTPTFFLNGQKLDGVGYWNRPGNAEQSLEPKLRAAIGS